MASPSLAARAAILGVPYQPNKRPDPLGVVKAIEALDAKAMATSAGAIVRDTLADLNAVTNPPAHQMGWVTGDATAANNGIYENAGSPSAPNWQRRADLLHGTIHMINVGAGTADAIVATSSLPLPVAPGAAFMTVNILAANTGSVTLNGKPLRTNSGNEIAPGGLTAGSIHAFLDLGDHFRLFSDQASAAIVAAVEGLVAQAEADATRAEAARDAALGAVPNVFVSTRTALAALDTTTVTAAYLKEAGREGQFIWRDGDYSAEVTADTMGAIYVKADAVAATAGAWVRSGGWAVTGVDVRWFGALSDEVSPSFNSTDAIEAALNLYHRVVFPEGTFLTDGHIVSADGRFISGAGIGKTILKSTGAINQSVLTGVGERFRVEDMTIDGSGDTMVAVTPGAGDGAFCLASYNNNNVEFRRLRLVNAYNKMMVFDGNNGVLVEYCVIDGEGLLDQNQDGIHCYGGTSVDCQNVTIRKNIFTGQVRAGVYLDTSVKHVLVEDNYFFNNAATIEFANAIVAMVWCDDIVIRRNTTDGYKHSVLVRCGVGTISILHNSFLNSYSAPISFQGQSVIYDLVTAVPDANLQVPTRTIEGVDWIVLLKKATIKDNEFSFSDIAGNLLESNTSGCVSVIGFLDENLRSIHDEIEQSGNSLVYASATIPRYLFSAMGANDRFIRWSVTLDYAATSCQRIHTSLGVSPAENFIVKQCHFSGLTEDSVFDGHRVFVFEDNFIDSFREGLSAGNFMYVNADVARINRNVGNADRCSMAFLVVTPGVVIAPASRYFVKGNELIDSSGNTTNVGIAEVENHHIPLMDETTRGGNRYYIWMDADLNLRRSDPNTPPTTYASGAVT